jgi:hypothetical protein
MIAESLSMILIVITHAHVMLTLKTIGPEGLVKKEAGTTENQLNHEGQPWRTLKPLDCLKEEITKSGFSINYIHVNENPWLDHATIAFKKNK